MLAFRVKKEKKIQMQIKEGEEWAKAIGLWPMTGEQGKEGEGRRLVSEKATQSPVGCEVEHNA